MMCEGDELPNEEGKIQDSGGHLGLGSEPEIWNAGLDAHRKHWKKDMEQIELCKIWDNEIDIKLKTAK